MEKIGARKRCGNSPGVGHITNVTYDDITATGASPSFGPTLWGESGRNRISGVTFTDVHMTVPGGNLEFQPLHRGTGQQEPVRPGLPVGHRLLRHRREDHHRGHRESRLVELDRVVRRQSPMTPTG
jgi:hypothetical protein